MMISIIVPVAKEGGELCRRIYDLHRSLNHASASDHISYEIILASDIFHAPTLKAMMKLAKQGVARSLFLTHRVGKGGSIKNAVPYARGEYIVVLDADIPMKPEFIHRLVLLAVKSRLNLLIANRVYRTHSLTRRVLSVAYNTLVNLFFRTGLEDHQAGFKILSRRAADVILAHLTRTDGLAYDTEVIVWARKYGLKYKTVNVIWREQRTESTIPPLRAILTMLADLVILRLLVLARKYAALQKLAIGSVVDLGDMRSVGREFMTVIHASGFKKYILSMLRRPYVVVAFWGGRPALGEDSSGA